jgi:hypothetical protein
MTAPGLKIGLRDKDHLREVDHKLNLVGELNKTGTQALSSYGEGVNMIDRRSWIKLSKIVRGMAENLFGSVRKWLG